MDAAARSEILNRYADHVRRFDELASRVQADVKVVPDREPRQGPGPLLTKREVEVLQLIAQGLTNVEIGRRLILSEETVKVHIRNLLARLQARSRAHAVAVGLRRAIID